MAKLISALSSHAATRPPDAAQSYDQRVQQLIRVEDLLVQSITLSKWRVCDRTIPAYDVRTLLGFIEERDGRFEVMEIGHGFQWFAFGSLSDAIANFARGTLPATSFNDHVLAGLRNDP